MFKLQNVDNLKRNHGKITKLALKLMVKFHMTKLHVDCYFLQLMMQENNGNLTSISLLLRSGESQGHWQGRSVAAQGFASARLSVWYGSKCSKGSVVPH